MPVSTRKLPCKPHHWIADTWENTHHFHSIPFFTDYNQIPIQSICSELTIIMNVREILVRINQFNWICIPFLDSPKFGSKNSTPNIWAINVSSSWFEWAKLNCQPQIALPKKYVHFKTTPRSLAHNRPDPMSPIQACLSWPNTICMCIFYTKKSKDMQLSFRKFTIQMPSKQWGT